MTQKTTKGTSPNRLRMAQGYSDEKMAVQTGKTNSHTDTEVRGKKFIKPEIKKPGNIGTFGKLPGGIDQKGRPRMK